MARTILTFRDIVGLEGRILQYVVLVVVAGNEIEGDDNEARQQNQNETRASAEAFDEARQFYLPHRIVEISSLFFSRSEEIKDDSASSRESGRVFVVFAVSAIDSASGTHRPPFVSRFLLLSYDIVHRDADIRPFAVHRSLRLLRPFDEERRSSNGCRASREGTTTDEAKRIISSEIQSKSSGSPSKTNVFFSNDTGQWTVDRYKAFFARCEYKKRKCTIHKIL